MAGRLCLRCGAFSPVQPGRQQRVIPMMGVVHAAGRRVPPLRAAVRRPGLVGANLCLTTKSQPGFNLCSVGYDHAGCGKRGQMRGGRTWR